MPENILVVEYEPRWADRVRQALTGQPFHALFAKDGEEAMRSLDSFEPKLIVLSSVIPKISAPDLIRIIRGRAPLQRTPILLTVSGYTGSAPKQDAVRMGASDLLPKPYTEAEFLLKVQQMLGVGQLTSNEIFGDLLDSTPVSSGPKKHINHSGDVDEMLEATLAGVMRKRDPAAKPKTAPGTSDLDKRLQDTLSGLEKSARRTSPGTAPVPPPPPAAAPPFVEHVPVSQPVFPPPAVVVAPELKEEEEPADGIRFGQYVLLEKIATGGMAEVWKARMRGVEGFQKIVAIKKILPHLSDNQEFIEMFVDEAKLAAQLNHNNIIHIYDLGKIASSYYIAMEYVDGHDLKTILNRAKERDNPFTIELALFAASKIASALDYAHRKRDYDHKEMELVHRDVSPQNVLMSQEGDIKLCDFGIAKAASKASHTQVGALKGKLQYMSPEQASGKPIDRRSDIFALGAVLFEMLTGRKLFTGDSEMSILEQVREARVVPASQFNEEVTANIDRVVFKALEKDPAARYQTAGEMGRDIDSILYSFKPTPTSADLAIYMHHLWSAEAQQPQPAVQPPPAPAEVDDAEDLAVVAAAAAPVRKEPARVPVAAPAAAAMPAWDAPPSATKKRLPVVPIAVAAILVAGIVGAFFYIRGQRSASTATSTSPVTTSQVASSSPARAPAATGTVVPVTDGRATTGSAAMTPGAAAQPVPDSDLVNREVQKRLTAERVRLEQQSRAQQQPSVTASTVAPAVRPAPVQQTQTQPPPTQTVPPPVQTASAAPGPPPTATQEPPAQTEPAAAAPRVREGDLVPTGTEGLVPGRVLRRGNVPYPPMAKAQRVQGTVILTVLVSETGQVLEVRILRGLERGAGLNEAAEQIMRRSVFSPPTKDGVRVKAWTTVPVDFKL